MEDEIKQKILASLQRLLELEGGQHTRIDALIREVTDNDVKRQIIMTGLQSVRAFGMADGISMMLAGRDIAEVMKYLSAEYQDIDTRMEQLYELEVAQREAAEEE